MSKHISHNAQQTEQFGAALGSRLQPGDFIALFGKMGTGKTTFINGVAKGMGIVDFVSSPTFALIHEYAGVIPLYHFDMYRINSWDDLYSTGYFDYCESKGVIAVEWSENIEMALPATFIKVELIAGQDVEERCILITEENNIDNTCC